MQYSIQNILSNPYLLKEVSDDTIQEWLIQYPYVSLFQLYALKNKSSYSESELNKTAFFFNNREKLHTLLNNTDPAPKYPDSSVITELKQAEPVIEIEDSHPTPTLSDNTTIETVVIAEDDKNEKVLEEKKGIDAIEAVEETTEKTTGQPTIENTAEVSKPENETNIQQIQTADKTEEPVVPTNDTPSIADQILAEITQMRAEREQNKPAPESALISEKIESVNDKINAPASDEIENENESESVTQENYSDNNSETTQPASEEKINQDDLPDLFEIEAGPNVIQHTEFNQPIEDIFIPTVEQTNTVKQDEPVQTNPNNVIEKIKTVEKPKQKISKKTEATTIPLPESKEEITEVKNEITKLNTAIDTKEPHTFIEWLKLLDGNLQIQNSASKDKNDDWIEIPQYEVEQTIKHKTQIQDEESKLFEPVFEEGEVDLFNEIDEEVTKIATESVRFNESMMTETLAKIYLKQGKTEKALDIYNHLQLKFPKKSAYFAALIKKIKEE